jgi:hypothetical protein
MNRSIKSLILAAGVAVATLTVTVPAHADGVPNGPGNLGTVQPGPVVDPKPEPTPVPAGPDEIVNPPHCTHGCGGNQGPEGPKDLGNPAPTPEGPKDLGNPAPGNDKPDNGPSAEPTDPAHDAPLDQGCSTGCDLPEGPAADATQAVETAPLAHEDGSINPLWFVLGGAGAGALVLAAVARRRRQQATGSDSAA